MDMFMIVHDLSLTRILIIPPLAFINRQIRIPDPTLSLSEDPTHPNLE